MNTKELKQITSPNRRAVLTISSEASVSEALNLMSHEHVHHLVVLKDKEYFGLVSARDLLYGGDGHNWYGSTTKITVGQTLRTLTPPISERTDIRAALSLMLQNGVTALPVIKDGAVFDIVTETDLLRLIEKLVDDRHQKNNLVSKGEAALAHPSAQRLVHALGEMGI